MWEAYTIRGTLKTDSNVLSCKCTTIEHVATIISVASDGAQFRHYVLNPPVIINCHFGSFHEPLDLPTAAMCTAKTVALLFGDDGPC